MRIETWLGNTVLVEHLGGLPPEEDDVSRKVVAEDLAAYFPQRVKTSLLILENYNRFGIEVRFRGDSEPRFLSWAAVLRIAGIDQEASEDAEESLRERKQP